MGFASRPRVARRRRRRAAVPGAVLAHVPYMSVTPLVSQMRARLNALAPLNVSRMFCTAVVFQGKDASKEAASRKASRKLYTLDTSHLRGPEACV